MKTIFVAALKEETPELSKFYHTGVGKINAAMAAYRAFNESYETIINHNNKHHDYDLKSLFIEKGYNKNNIFGKPVIKPGIFNHVKAVGWIVDAYQRAQISINFTSVQDLAANIIKIIIY